MTTETFQVCNRCGRLMKAVVAGVVLVCTVCAELAHSKPEACASAVCEVKSPGLPHDHQDGPRIPNTGGKIVIYTTLSTTSSTATAPPFILRTS